MSIKNLQKNIRNNEGFILSTDTLNLTHLLPSAYDLMVKYNMRTSLKQEIESVFVNTDSDDTEKLLPTFYNQFHGLIKIPTEKQEEASYLWNIVYNIVKVNKMVKMLTSKNQEQQEAGLQINEILNIFKKEVLKNV